MSSPATYHQTHPSQRSLLGHISFGVSSYTASKSFYTAALAPSGIVLTYDNPDTKFLSLGFAHDSSEIISIFERKEPLPPWSGSHVAFNAPSRGAVREFWEAAMAGGAEDNGPPDFRGEETGPGQYYPAFLLILMGVGWRLYCKGMKYWKRKLTEKMTCGRLQPFR